MQGTERSRIPTVLLATVATVGSSRVLRLMRGWRAGLREFAIIAASVLVALAGQAWWQAREERTRELQYLRQLLADTRENERRLTETITYDSLAVEANVKVQAVLARARPTPSADSVLDWMRRAGSTTDFNPVSGTYRALIGTGDLRLVSNDSLRSRLTQYAARLESEGENQRDLRMIMIEQSDRIGRALPFVRRLSVRRPTAADVQLERWRTDPEVETLMYVFHTALLNRIDGLRQLRGGTRALVKALEAEPGAELRKRS